MIGYGPIIPKSPTDAAVVGLSLEYCMSVASKVGQEHTVVTCDQTIYEIALGLKKKNPAKFESLIIRMGGFILRLIFWEPLDFSCAQMV